MPYIVTTRPPDRYLTVHPLARRAVATLEEALDVACTIARDYPPLDYGPRSVIDESGGTVGPFPDGTEITVEPCPYSSLAGFAGLTVEQMPSDAEIIDAYNARQETRA